MHFYSILSIITFLLRVVLTMTLNSDEIYVVQNLTSSGDYSLMELTCMSEDKDAALIWNYDINNETTTDYIENFKPLKPTSENLTECAIWRSEKCLVSWEDGKNWTIVNSLVEPMSPIVDYRWEGFTKYNLTDVTGEDEYAIVPELPNSLNGTLVFSVRGIRDIVIRLCGNDNSTISSCYLIKIMAEGRNSVIETCISNTSITSDSELTESQTCEKLENVTHETAILDASEWRTFSLQWISNEILLNLFDEVTEEAVFDSIPIVQDWYSVSNISVTSETAASLKFHIYDYFLGRRENEILQTAKFNHSEKNFCIDILVSICPDCQLNVSLINAKHNMRMIERSIFGSEQFILNGLRTWRSIKLNMTLQSSSFLTLRITSVLNKANCTDIWWAIGNLNFCERYDSVRESTIKVRVSNMTSDVMPEIKCQKLVHDKIVIADSTTFKPFNDTKQLRQFIRKGMTPCSPEYRNFNGIDCNLYDCTCYNGFGKIDGKDCFDVVQGKWNITLIEGLNSTTCPMENSTIVVFNESGEKRLGEKICPIFPCSNNEVLKSYSKYNVRVNLQDGTTFFRNKIKTLESAPGEIRELTFESIFADNVTGEWKSPLETNGRIRNYTVTIQRIKLLGCEDFNKTSPLESKKQKTVNETTASFSGLHPYAQYNFTVIANTIEPGSPLSKVFETHQLSHPTSKISDLRIVNETVLVWNRPENCTTITSPVKGTVIIVSGVSSWVQNWKVTISTEDTDYDLKMKNLLPYTCYKARAWVNRVCDKPVCETNFQEISWTTAPTAPSAVRNLVTYEADAEANTISIRWEPPYLANGEIELYQMLLVTGNSVIEKKSIKVFELKNCMLTYVCFENFSFPSNISTNIDLELQIFAKNINVTMNGAKNSKVFKLEDFYNEEVHQPLKIEAIPQSYGITKLKWMHPLFSPTKIVRFRINITLLETNLTTNRRIENQMYDYLIKKKEDSYNKEFFLLTSTKYCIEIEAVDNRNRFSNATSVNVSLPGSVRFSTENKLKVNMRNNGKTVEFEVPSIVNWTMNTMLVVTVRGVSTCKKKSSGNPSSYDDETNTLKWIVAIRQVNSSEPINFTFNVDQHYIVEKKCSFRPHENYQFVLTLNDSSMERISLKSEQFIFINDKPQDYRIWCTSIFIPITCFVVSYILFRKYRTTRLEPNDAMDLLLFRDTTHSNDWISPCTIQQSSPTVVSRKPQVSIVGQMQPHFYPVSIQEFEEYVREALAGRILESQWEILSKGLSKSCEYGYLPCNRHKNRFTHILPYDENRIILERTLNDPYSDYINASYIQGRRKAKTYIATQGPKRDKETKTNTVPDFWRMVWQENVHIICMLTKVIEDGEKKCEQYWPENGKSVQYGDAVVLNTDQQVFIDYTIRTLQLMCREGKREVKHFHYTEWPEHGIPMYTQSFATFLKKLLVTPSGKGPTVVHSCSGIGRTGTFIVCDISLRQAIKERMINIPTVTQKIRRNRANMVENLQQYVFAHLVIAECMIAQHTQIPCDDQLRKEIDQLRKQLPSDIRRLRRMVLQDRELHSIATKPPIEVNTTPNKSWELNDDKLAELAELSLPSLSHSSSNSFHVVSVKGVQRKEQYLATRLPSPFTLPDLWRLIAEKEIELIIVLQRPDTKDDKYCDIVSDERGALHFYHIQLTVKSTLEDEECFTKENFLLTDTSQFEARDLPVTILTCKGWTYGTDEQPPAPAELVSLWIASEKVKRNESPTLVICRDGVTGCGLYLALSFLLDRMSLERQCDVISAVRVIQRSEPNFVQSLKQFEYLYDAAINYHARFETYANFS